MWAVSGLSALEYGKLALFYGSWVYVLAAPALLWVIWRVRGRLRMAAIIGLAGMTILAYARFVEPRILHVKEHAITLPGCFPQAGAVRLGVVSDMHIGLFASAMPIARISKRLEQAQTDAVLIPGDFTYFLDPTDFKAAFRPLRGIRAPVYVVFGNHDVGLPSGDDVTASLSRDLTALGMINVENRSHMHRGRHGESAAEIVGLSDFWQGRQRLAPLSQQSAGPRILLTHNPDTALSLPEWATYDLMIAGHTHGGQINLGGVTCALIPEACRVTRAGLTRTPSGRTVFVTTGTGMVSLPLRFMMPPRIDILATRWTACAPNQNEAGVSQAAEAPSE